MRFCTACRTEFEGTVRDRRRQPACPRCGSASLLPALPPGPFVIYDEPDPPCLPPPWCRDAIHLRGPRTNRELVPLLAARDGWACHLCGEPIDPGADPESRQGATIDHVIPRSDGGSRWKRSNMRLAHRGCNNARGSHSVTATRLALERSRRPHPSGSRSRSLSLP